MAESTREYSTLRFAVKGAPDDPLVYPVRVRAVDKVVDSMKSGKRVLRDTVRGTLKKGI